MGSLGAVKNRIPIKLQLTGKSRLIFQFLVIRGRAKDCSHEKLKTWIDLHGAQRSGM